MLIRVSPAIQVKSVRIASSAQLLEHPVAGRPAGEAGGDHRAAEQAQRAGDVDPLAAGHRAALDRPVAVTESEVRDRDRAVDRRVEGDGEDHRVGRLRTTAAISIADSASASQSALSPTKLRTRSRVLASGTARPARSGTRRRRSPSTSTVARPSVAPAPDRPLDLAGRPHRDRSVWPRRTPTATLRARAAAARRRCSGSRASASASPARTGTRLRYWEKPYSSSSRVSPSRRLLGRRAEHRRDQLDPLAAAGADQDVVGVERVAGLHPGRPGRGEQEVVERRDPARRAQAAQHGAARGGDPGEDRDRAAGAASARSGRRRWSSCRARRARSGWRSGCRQGRARPRSGSSRARSAASEPAAASARS